MREYDHVYTYYQIGDQIDSGDALSSQNIVILNCAYAKSLPRDLQIKHSHGFLEIFFFEKGEGILEIDGAAVKLQGNQLLVVDAKAEHVQHSVSQDDPLVYFNIFIESFNLAGYQPNCLASAVEGNKNRYYLMRLGENNAFLPKVFQIINEIKGKEKGYKLKIKSLFNALFVDIIRALPLRDSFFVNKEKHNAVKNSMKTIKKYIEEHYAEDISLDSLSKLAFLSKSYMINQYEKMFALSPIQHLTLVRIENAKRMLVDTDKSVTEIAALAGYNNSAYFSEIFIKYVGISPTVYRKASQNF